MAGQWITRPRSGPLDRGYGTDGNGPVRSCTVLYGTVRYGTHGTVQHGSDTSARGVQPNRRHKAPHTLVDNWTLLHETVAAQFNTSNVWPATAAPCTTSTDVSFIKGCMLLAILIVDWIYRRSQSIDPCLRVTTVNFYNFGILCVFNLRATMRSTLVTLGNGHPRHGTDGNECVRYGMRLTKNLPESPWYGTVRQFATIYSGFHNGTEYPEFFCHHCQYGCGVEHHGPAYDRANSAWWPTQHAGGSFGPGGHVQQQLLSR